MSTHLSPNDVTKEYRFLHEFKWHAKNEEIAKTISAVIGMADSFHLGVGEGDTEELLVVVPEELTNKVLEVG